MISFQFISQNNNEDILNLKIKPSQESYIETIAQCLKESEELSLWKPVGIYNDNILIGFAMFGLWNENNEERVWLDRFLIDYRFQGQGLGKKALDAIVKYIMNLYHCKSVYLSLYQDNNVAYHLYKSYGFIELDEKDIHGENVMKYEKISPY
ncbi:MAG: GNAT family N-acetyltransferase [Coprobacillus sp.]